MQLKASRLCLLVILVAALDWALGCRRANGMTHQTLPLFGQSLDPPVCLSQEGRETQGGETGINWLMRPCLPSRGQKLCMHYYPYYYHYYKPHVLTIFSYDYITWVLVKSKLDWHTLSPWGQVK